LPTTDPNNFRSAFCRERSDTDDGQKECAEVDRAEFFAQRKLDVVLNIAEEKLALGAFELVQSSARRESEDQRLRAVGALTPEGRSRRRGAWSFASKLPTLNPPSQTTADRHPTSNAELNPAAISDRDYNDLFFCFVVARARFAAARVSQSGINGALGTGRAIVSFSILRLRQEPVHQPASEPSVTPCSGEPVLAGVAGY